MGLTIEGFGICIETKSSGKTEVFGGFTGYRTLASADQRIITSQSQRHATTV